jgi:hypothetical protein
LLRCLETDRKYAAFFCDDDVFFGIAPEIKVAPGECFSLRFGDGVGDGCSPDFVAAAIAAMPPMLPGTQLVPAGAGPQSRGYALAGNVHLAEELRGQVALVSAHEPNSLEVDLNTKRELVTEKHGPKNCVLSIPHNLVQDVFNNPNMGGSAAELNQRYLAGERIDLDAMDFSHVIDAHQFIQYVFRKAR